MRLFLKLKRIKFQSAFLTHLFLWVSMFMLSGQMHIFANDELNTPATNQARIVQGVVTDNFEEPLPGVNITIKGTTTGVMTGADGSYSINVPDENVVLVFSYIGFVKQEILVGNQTVINLTMKEDTQQIEEVVVVGYGVVRKSDLTSAVSSISTKTFQDQPVYRVQQIFEGRSAGVAVTNTSGMIGSNPQIRIRGATSYNLSNDPLYVIDGVPTGVGSLNPSDIQSIEILKDASATAIYGSRGSNGVILVTTKKGQAGKPKVEFNSTLGVSRLAKRYDLLNAYEFALVVNEILGANTIGSADLEAYKNGTKGIDWQDLMTQTGFDQNYTLSVSGGNQTSQYLISGSVLDQTAITITATYSKYLLRANLNTQVSSWFDIATNINLARTQSHNGGINWLQTINLSPSMELKNPETGNWNFDPYQLYRANPYAERMENYSDDFSDNALVNVDFRFKIADGLSLSVLGGIDYGNSRGFDFQARASTVNNTNSMRNTAVNSLTWQVINNLTYLKQFGNHRLTATAVWEVRNSESTSIAIDGSNIANEFLGYWNIGNAGTRTPSNEYSASSMVSGIFRVIYNYKDRYMIQGTYRGDGSSKFQGDNKWGFFPSVSVAWDVAKEEFFSSQNFLQQLKLRASYGASGNQGISNYSTLGMLSSNTYAWGLGNNLTGYWGNSFATPYVSWESTYQTDIGLDFSVLNRRLNVSFDWFLKETKDLLFQKTVPGYNGGGSFWVNNGQINNKGIELSLDAIPFRTNNFQWETVLHAGYVKNEVINLGGEERILGPSDTTYGGVQTITQPGYPLRTFYMYPWAGFDDQGRNLYIEENGDLVITPSSTAQKIMDKKGDPDWTFGWNNMFNYKNWTLNLFMTASIGAYRLNQARYQLASSTPQYIIPALREGYFKGWDKVANKADAKYPTITNPGNHIRLNSDFWLENASFLKLKNINIGYNIPRSVLKYVDAHVSLTATELFKFTKYQGMDPETWTGNTGVDNGAYPIPRTFTFNLNLKF